MERTTGIEELASALGISVESIWDVGHRKGLQAAVLELCDCPYETTGEDHVSDIIRAYLSASNQVLVPRVPTEHMVNDGLNCDAWAYGRDSAVDMISETFKVMVSAAPNPFKDK